MSKIEDAINSYVETAIDNHISDLDWRDIISDSVDFEDMISKAVDWDDLAKDAVKELNLANIVSEEVDFGDLARDALIENVSTALDDAIPGALRDFDFKEFVRERVDFAELAQQNIDWHEAAKDAVETEMARQFHDLERAIDDKVTQAVSLHEGAIESLKGEITMLKLEIAKLKDGAKPKTWLQKVAAVFGL